VGALATGGRTDLLPFFLCGATTRQNNSDDSHHLGVQCTWKAITGKGLYSFIGPITQVGAGAEFFFGLAAP